MTKRDFYNDCRDMARTRRGLEALLARLGNASLTVMQSFIIRAAIRDIHPRFK